MRTSLAKLSLRIFHVASHEIILKVLHSFDATEQLVMFTLLQWPSLSAASSQTVAAYDSVDRITLATSILHLYLGAPMLNIKAISVVLAVE